MVVCHKPGFFHPLAGDKFGFHTAAAYITQPEIIAHTAPRRTVTVYVDAHLSIHDGGTESGDCRKKPFQFVVVATIVGIQHITPLYKTECMQRIAPPGRASAALLSQGRGGKQKDI